ncbi:MAG TPA: tail fiber protein [Allosphingosinicella sp.]|jgi:microcystin-dependent protein
MAQPYIGEIRMFAGNFPPVGWMFCNGDLLAISENDALFVLIGTTYGGDGESNFALPNLQSRIPIHMGSNGGTSYQLAEMAGTEQETLTSQQMPNHTHSVLASTGPGNLNTPAGNVIGVSAAVKVFIEDDPLVNMSAQAVGVQGGSQPHTNCQPYLCINYIISLFGIFPTQN